MAFNRPLEKGSQGTHIYKTRQNQWHFAIFWQNTETLFHMLRCLMMQSLLSPAKVTQSTNEKCERKTMSSY